MTDHRDSGSDVYGTLQHLRLNRRDVIRGGVGLGLGTFLIARGAAGAADNVTFWYATNPNETDYAKAVVAAWNKSNKPQVNAQPVPAGNSTEEVVLAAIAARTTPCALANVAPAAVPQFGNGLVDLSKDLKDAESFMVARSGKSVIDQYRSTDGDLYQLPWKVNPVMVFFNKAMWSKAGLDAEKPPVTYTEALDAMGKLKAAGITPIEPTIDQTWYNRWFDWYPLYLAAGNKLLLDDKQSKAIFNDAAGKASMTFWRDVYAKGYAPKASWQQNPYDAGKVAMYIAGPWAIPDMEKGGVLKDTGVMPVWVPDDSPVAKGGTMPNTFADTKNIGIFSTCDDKDGTWKFLEFYVSPENDKKFFEMTQQIPLRQGIDQAMGQAFFTKNPLLEPFAKQAAHTLDVDPTAKSIDIFTAISQAYQECAIYSKSSVDDALAKAEKTVNGLVGS